MDRSTSTLATSTGAYDARSVSSAARSLPLGTTRDHHSRGGIPARARPRVSSWPDSAANSASPCNTPAASGRRSSFSHDTPEHAGRGRGQVPEPSAFERSQYAAIRSASFSWEMPTALPTPLPSRGSFRSTETREASPFRATSSASTSAKAGGRPSTIPGVPVAAGVEPSRRP